MCDLGHGESRGDCARAWVPLRRRLDGDRGGRVGERSVGVEGHRRRRVLVLGPSDIEAAHEAAPAIREGGALGVYVGEVVAGALEPELEDVVGADRDREVLRALGRPVRVHLVAARRQRRLDHHPVGERARQPRGRDGEGGDAEAGHVGAHAHDEVRLRRHQPARRRRVEAERHRHALAVGKPHRVVREALLVDPAVGRAGDDRPGLLGLRVAGERAVQHQHVEARPHLLAGRLKHRLRVDGDGGVVLGAVVVEQQLVPPPLRGIDLHRQQLARDERGDATADRHRAPPSERRQRRAQWLGLPLHCRSQGHESHRAQHVRKVCELRAAPRPATASPTSRPGSPTLSSS